MKKGFLNANSEKVIGVINPFGTNLTYYKNPKMAAWWSAAFPGFGHILLGQYFKGSLLFIWEIFINIKSHLNTGLVSTLQGHFEQTKSVLDPHWILLYIPIYLFAVWDCYHTANEINRSITPLSKLNFPLRTKAFNAVELNLFTERKPAISLFWSLLFPGAGQFYLHRLLESLLFSIWFIVICYYSHIYEGVLYLLIGDLRHSNDVLNPAWFMFLPSIFCFSAYNAYSDAIDTNIIYRFNEIQKIKQQYQDPEFTVSFPK